jgi:hypothetical protein
MSLGEKSTGRVGHHLATVSVVTISHELRRLTTGTQTQRLITDDFIAGEIVIQFDHVDITRTDARGFEYFNTPQTGYVVPRRINHTTRKRLLVVRAQRHCCQLYLARKAPLAGEALGYEERRSGTRSGGGNTPVCATRR